LTAGLAAPPSAQTAKPVTMTDIDTLAGHRAMSLDIRSGDKSIEREVRAHVDARMQELGIKVLPPGQLPVFRVELDAELISSERTPIYTFYNVVAEFVVPVADPRDTTKTFLSPSWRSRHAALVGPGNFQPVPVPLLQATGDFAAAYKKANATVFALTRAPLRQLKITDKQGLLAAVGQQVVVTGTVTSVERINLNGDGMHLYLDNSKEFYVVVMPAIFAEVAKKLGGDAVVGKTIAVRLNPLFLVGNGPFPLAPSVPDNIEIVR
jgi:hypothetical protein